jgi:hypothetical protein
MVPLKGEPLPLALGDCLGGVEANVGNSVPVVVAWSASWPKWTNARRG